MTGEEFIKTESGLYSSNHKILGICLIEDKNAIKTF